MVEPASNGGSRRPLLIRLSGDPETATLVLERVAGGEPADVVSLAELRQTIRQHAGTGGAVGVVGSPPEGDIGYPLVPLATCAIHPERVVQIDVAGERVSSQSLARFVAGQAGPAIRAAVLSSIGVVAQRVAAKVLRRGAAGAATRDLRRVLYVRPLVGVPAHVGGSVTHAHGVIGALQGLGLSVDPITTDSSIVATALSDPDVEARWRLATSTSAWKALPASAAFGGDLALASLARSAAAHPDLVYQRHTRFSLSGAAIARATRTPLFLEYNGSEVFFGKHWQSTPLMGQLQLCEDAVLASAARIFVVAEEERRRLMARDISPERVVVNPNGVDPDRFANGGGPELRRELGISPESNVIGFVGSFGPWHGGLVLARAFSALTGRRGDVVLMLIGEGAERTAVLDLLRTNGGLGNAVVRGRVAPADIPRHLDACDILVSPHVPLPDGSEFFGSPTKLFEYMAAGKAIVASRLGQIAEVLEDGRSGVLVTPGDAGALTDALAELIDAPARRERLGAAARADASSRHTWAANAQRIVDAYRSLEAC